MPTHQQDSMVPCSSYSIPNTLTLGIKGNGKRMEHNLSLALQAIANQLDPTQLVLEPGSTLSSNLCHAQKQLKNAKQEANKLRKAHLEELLNQAIAAHNTKSPWHSNISSGPNAIYDVLPSFDNIQNQSLQEA